MNQAQLQTTSDFKYLPHLDGQRAVAIISVLIFHFGFSFGNGGFIGVDVFFVISGYLITSIINHEVTQNHFSLINFYLKRVRRIFPSFLLVTIATLLIGFFVLTNEEFEYLGQSTVKATLFWSNVWLKKQAGYFDINSDLKPFLHYWSLALEEQFYFIWPVLLTLLVKLKNKKNFILVLFILTLFSFSYNIYLTPLDPSSSFYLLGSRFWQLSLGGVLGILSINIENKVLNEFFSLIGLSLILYGTYCFSKSTIFPGWAALIPTFGAILIITIKNRSCLNNYLLCNPFMTSVGKISYPLYLWHWPIVYYLRITTHLKPTLVQTSMGILLSFILAYLTTNFFEVKFRKLSPRSTKIYFLILIQASLCLIGLFIYGHGNLNKLDSSFEKEIGYKTLTEPNCFLGLKTNEQVFCYSEKKSLPVTKLIIGDSFALSFYASFLNQTDSNWGLFSKVNYIPWDLANDSDYKIVLDFLKLHQEISEVWLVYSSRKLDPNSSLIEKKHSDQGKTTEEIYTFFSSIISQVRTRDRKVYILKSQPSLVETPKLCAHRPFLLTPNQDFPGCIQNRTAVIRLFENYTKTLAMVKSNFPEVVILDPIELFCDKENCRTMIDSKSLYSYSDHVSEYGARMIVKFLRERKLIK